MNRKTNYNKQMKYYQIKQKNLKNLQKKKQNLIHINNKFKYKTKLVS